MCKVLESTSPQELEFFMIKKEWFYIITNAIAWFYSYPPEKNRDTRRELCAGGKHTATCDRGGNQIFGLTRNFLQLPIYLFLDC